TSVIRVQASDRDDPAEGLNARLTYSLERNVVESSGLPIFEVDTQLGLVTTALCCLDREQTDHYTLHVVATDGGGLKVLDPDVTNDFAFRVSGRWNEWGTKRVNGMERVVPGSGRGWQMFTVEGRGGTTTNNNNNNNNNNNRYLEKLRRNEQKIGNERINNERRNEEGSKRRKTWGDEEGKVEERR
ncbi:hypothetical protein Pcinc_040751, partial [Petrolisthes cinctipes]